MQGPSFSKLLHSSQFIFSRRMSTLSRLYRETCIANHLQKLHLSSQPVTATNCNKKGFAFVRQISSNSHVPKDFGGPKTLERFRIRDGVPKSYTLIYRTNLPNYLLSSQVVVILSVGAVITAFGVYMLAKDISEEEWQQKTEKLQQKVDKKLKKDSESELQKLFTNFKEDRGIKDAPATPSLRDFTEPADATSMAFIFSSLIILTIALFKLQNMLPVRIYVNEKTKHCIAVKYGHLLPGKLTWHEFLAGTVQPTKGIDAFVHGVYKDGSGKTIILMDHFFRSGADFNMVMGFENEFEEEVEKQTRKRK